jgi:hypothetical protein
LADQLGLKVAAQPTNPLIVDVCNIYQNSASHSTSSKTFASQSEPKSAIPGNNDALQIQFPSPNPLTSSLAPISSLPMNRRDSHEQEIEHERDSDSSSQQSTAFGQQKFSSIPTSPPAASTAVVIPTLNLQRARAHMDQDDEVNLPEPTSRRRGPDTSSTTINPASSTVDPPSVITPTLSSKPLSSLSSLGQLAPINSNNRLSSLPSLDQHSFKNQKPLSGAQSQSTMPSVDDDMARLNEINAQLSQRRTESSTTNASIGNKLQSKGKQQDVVFDEYDDEFQSGGEEEFANEVGIEEYDNENDVDNDDDQINDQDDDEIQHQGVSYPTQQKKYNAQQQQHDQNSFKSKSNTAALNNSSMFSGDASVLENESFDNGFDYVESIDY